MSSEATRQILRVRESYQQYVRLLRLVRPYWPQLGGGLAMGTVVTLIGLAPPYLLRFLIDHVYAAGDVSLMHVVVAGLAAMAASHALLGALRSYYTAYTTFSFGIATLLLFLNHMQHLPVRFFDRNRVGEIMSRFQEIRRAVMGINYVIETLLASGMYLLVVPPMMMLLEWRLTLVMVAAIVPLFLLNLLAAAGLHKRWDSTALVVADMEAYRAEVLAQIRTYKALAAERFVYEQALQKSQAHFSAYLRAVGFSFVVKALSDLVAALGLALFTWYGWRLILDGQLTVGTYVACAFLLGYVYNPIAQLTAVLPVVQDTAVSLARMYEYLDVPAEQPPMAVYEAPAAPAQPRCGELELRDVCFGYSAEEPVLRSVSLHVQAGTVTAVVGTSGSGKSSLFKLVTRTEIADSGTILLNGLPIEAIPLSDLRGSICVVGQDAGIIRGTLWENLTLGLRDVEPAVVEEAVRTCRLQEFVAELPAGYLTPVGESGATLSAGQRQRITLVRALIRRPPVLMLDEPTSHLDAETEADVLRSILATRGGCTIVFTTHRLATALLADRICVLDEGRLAGTGTHAQLMASCPAYLRLVRGGLEEVDRSEIPAGHAL